METKNPPQESMAGFDVASFRLEQFESDNTQNYNTSKGNFTGGGVYSCQPYNSIKIKIKKIIVKFGSHAPDLAGWLLNIFGLRSV